MRVVYCGTGSFAGPALEALLEGPFPPIALITQPEKPGSSERGSSRLVGMGIKIHALKKGIAIHQPDSINSPAGIALLKELAPDLLVVAAYGQILSKAALEIPRLGSINLHASLLPRHRGASPIAHAILAGDDQTGVTVIRMTAGLDAGEILAMQSTPIGPAETTGELEERLAKIAADLAVETVNRLASGAVSGQIQDSSQVTRAPKIRKEQGDLPFGEPVAQILRIIRAMQPWPTAFTHRFRADGAPARIQIVRAEAAPESSLAGESERKRIPGTLFLPAGRRDELWVQCADGPLRLLEVQPAGRKKMGIADYLRGNPLRDGDRFGPAPPPPGQTTSGQPLTVQPV